MKEYTVHLRFVTPSLGNVKDPKTGNFRFQRSDSGRILFMASWHKSNMRMASSILGSHQSSVDQILWDLEIDAKLKDHCLHRIYYTKGKGGKTRWQTHESLVAGQEIGINCVVPDAISEEDLWRLLTIAGKYKGLSPWQPENWGRYEVVTIRPRRA